MKTIESVGGMVREPGRTLIFKDILGDGEESTYLPVYAGSCRIASHRAVIRSCGLYWNYYCEYPLENRFLPTGLKQLVLGDLSLPSKCSWSQGSLMAMGRGSIICVYGTHRICPRVFISIRFYCWDVIPCGVRHLE